VVSVVSPAGTDSGDKTQLILSGLSDTDQTLLRGALAYAVDRAAGKTLDSGQSALTHMLGLAAQLAELNTDANTRIAGLLAPLTAFDPQLEKQVQSRFNADCARMLGSIRQLLKLRGTLSQHGFSGSGANATALWTDQLEFIRKMLLAMASDVRVVLIRVSSRLQTLRYFTTVQSVRQQEGPQWQTARIHAQETLDIYAPLANRLGVWQLKWELEDLAFRLLQPRIYKSIARMLDEKRTEREHFIDTAMKRIRDRLAAQGISCEVSGRPKHIYSIYNKMQGKGLSFENLHDVRACRVIVDDIKTCYTALSVVNELGTPIAEEFDDYIAKPKPNGYQSLHTVIRDDNGKTLEVQIRTRDMHQFAEYGMAAHWRYKEAGTQGYEGHSHLEGDFENRITWLRQLLAWKSDVTGSMAASSAWAERLRNVALDDAVYVFTPQGKVIELPKGSTPVDFAYHVHTDVGHKCRGAKVDGQMVPLNHALGNGQTIEIIAARGDQPKNPSRDWLNPALGYLTSQRARAKVRHWFAQQEHKETLERGKSLVERELQRIGHTAQSHDTLAHLLGFGDTEALYSALAHEEMRPRAIEQALVPPEPEPELSEDNLLSPVRRKRSAHAANESDVLVVGVDALLTQLAKCCRPVPPDPIVGFVTRGKGISIHRVGCPNLTEVARLQPERLLETTWGDGSDSIYPVDIVVQANDRQGLLKDITEAFAKYKVNVIGVKTASRKAQAHMQFTAEVHSAEQLNQVINQMQDVKGVFSVKRR
jgi:GTP pyrophosphokinase